MGFIKVPLSERWHMSSYEVTMVVFGALGLTFTAMTFVVLLIINIKK